MEKFLKWINDHFKLIVICLLAVVILSPIVISITSPSVSSEITADGLLGYIIQALSAVGTIALACVAVWQNERQKTENDVAQKRLEALTLQANEQYVVGKIIECESTRISRIKVLIAEFIQFCNPQEIQALYYDNYSIHDLKAQSRLSDLSAKMKDTMNALIMELNNDLCTDTTSLVAQCALTATDAENLINSLAKSRYGSESETIVLKKSMLDFLEVSNKYITEVDSAFSQLVYGNMTLSEIRGKYKPRQITEDA